MKRRPPDINALLEAITEAKPLPPPPPWMTLLEIMAEFAKRGQKVSKAMAHRRLQKLEEMGKLTKLRAPTRYVSGGVTTYYRLKPAKGR